MKKCSKLSQSDLVHDEVTCGLVQPSPSQPPGPDWTHLFPQLLTAFSQGVVGGGHTPKYQGQSI